jgi:hypothetical protein
MAWEDVVLAVIPQWMLCGNHIRKEENEEKERDVETCSRKAHIGRPDVADVCSACPFGILLKSLKKSSRKEIDRGPLQETQSVNRLSWVLCVIPRATEADLGIQNADTASGLLCTIAYKL